jgi:hypothetical protein
MRMNRQAVIPVAVLLTVLIGLLFVWIPAQASPRNQGGNPPAGSQLATSTPPPTSTSTPTPMPTLEVVTYQQMLTVNRDTLETIKWLLTFIVAALTLSGLGALFNSQRAVIHAAEAEAQIKTLQARADELKTTLESRQNELESLKKNKEELFKTLREQAAEIALQRKDLESTKHRASILQNRINEQIPTLVTLAEVDIRAMQLFSTVKRHSSAAKTVLLELSKDDIAVVRRECARVFGAMPDHPECFTNLHDAVVIARLREMTQNDPERGVRVEAKLALGKFEKDLDSKG